MTKQCPSCGEEKPATEFGRNRTLTDGLSFYCLACNRARNRAWYRDRRRSLGREVRDHSWIPEGFRWCPSCEQPVAHEDYTRNARIVSGFGSRCRACDRAANSAGYFYRKYKLSKAEVAGMRAAQDGRCAICGDPAQHLDHDHETGATRQLLCQRCNHGLGLFRDDPGLLHTAALYVDAHRERQLLARIQQSFVGSPGSERPSDGPPVGS
ncbi:endonuclease domain-containing protein [Geodermatophilus sp. DSM 45219]|uniref:endonuclease domain-containing protein n=1 Tax=Geodermatophilus sp. DSM 45219 TaxID=1881103 RepID=UPI0008857372|nr:endonuclease domain-containing protein [Geodermatophilus sp. DSM 45219]SDN72521.1 Recombination endonuclease VII [Geodermatophilus sp. DSM 45219]